MRIVVALALCACGTHDETEIEPSPCSDGLCGTVGVQPNGCAAGELFVDDGCVPAGAAARCGSGFVADERGGCSAVVPDGPCPPGTMPVLGETECRPLSSCGTGRWGDIPIDSSTVYVDAAYTALDADGSASRPFPTIQQGVQAASEGAIVAVAEGTYSEEIEILGPVRLWGRCADRVEVVGGDPAIVVGYGDGTEIRGLTVRDGTRGIGVTGSMGVLIDGVWLHDFSTGGVLVTDQLGYSDVVVRRSLVEHVSLAGVAASGSQVIVEGSWIRAVTPPGGGLGAGLLAQRSSGGTRGALTLRGSIVEQLAGVGVGALAGDVTVEGSLIRDGAGVEISPAPDTGEASWLGARSTVIERIQGAGILLHGSSAEIEGVVIRDVTPDPLTGSLHGIAAQSGAELSVRLSLLDRISGSGISLIDASADLRGVAVIDTSVEPLTARGYGMQLGGESGMAHAVVEGSLVRGSHRGGIVIAGSIVQIEGTLVQDTWPANTGVAHGVHVQSQAGRRSDVTIRHSIVERSHVAGFVVTDSDARVEATAIADTQANPLDGLFGDGIAAILWNGGGAQVTIVDSRVEKSARAAIANYGSRVSLQGTVIDCNGLDLDAETYTDPASFENLSGNRCGCGSTVRECKVVSTGLAPPAPLE